MPSKIRDEHRSRAKVFKALGHPTRLFLMEELGRGERCVCELRDMVHADISTVSKHLSLLKEAGVVSDRKEGLKVFYSLRIPCIMKFFDCLDEVERASAAACCTAKRKPHP